MKLSTAIPELKRISKEYFRQELTCWNLCNVIKVLKMKNLIIKLQTK